jgi:putative transposase
MTRAARTAPPGYVDHGLKRAVARLPLLHKDGDYDAFKRVLSEALQEHPTCLLAPTRRWHIHYHTLGSVHVDQRRFKSFPVQENEHFYHVVRHVERNALRANLVQHAEAWRWS